MIEKTRAIVLKQVKFSESSVVCKMYTRSFGLQSYLVNGVRSEKGKGKAGLLQPMNLLQLEAYHREGKNLQRLKEFSPLVYYNHLPYDVFRSAVGLFLVEVFTQCMHDEESNDDLFDFIEDQFMQLDKPETTLTFFSHRFLISLSKHMGFYPSGNCSIATPFFNLQEGSFVSQLNHSMEGLSKEESELFDDLLFGKVSSSNPLIRKNLLHQLVNYFQLHVSGFGKIKSLAVLEEVLHA